MNFSEAVSSVFSKYADFSGRARRSEFWWFFLFNVVASGVADILSRAIFGNDALGALYSLALLIPAVAVSVRRLHDVDRSGWWILIGAIPLIGAIVLIFWYATEGTAGENRYGPRA
ncbi:DUF805 domain-containing protein [Rhizobium sp. RAF56]|uniref:DUF805 domain-containing protein n=1 Tax=Rhizobium sp. RAF56 TaxID=3233062 RepID=UPI003F9CA250